MADVCGVCWGGTHTTKLWGERERDGAEEGGYGGRGKRCGAEEGEMGQGGARTEVGERDGGGGAEGEGNGAGGGRDVGQKGLKWGRAGGDWGGGFAAGWRAERGRGAPKGGVSSFPLAPAGRGRVVSAEGAEPGGAGRGLPRMAAARPVPPRLLLPLLVLAAGPGSGPLRVHAYFPEERWNPESDLRPPRVTIAVLARNAAHALPAALGALERLRHPKERTALWWARHAWGGRSGVLAGGSRGTDGGGGGGVCAVCRCPRRVAVDHSVDNTTAVLREWLGGVRGLYHRVEWRPMEEPR